MPSEDLVTRLLDGPVPSVKYLAGVLEPMNRTVYGAANTVRTPSAPFAPVAATEKFTVPGDSADMPTTTFHPADASPAMTRRPSLGVTDGVTPAGTFVMLDTNVPAAALDKIEGAVGEMARVGVAAADTVRVKIDDEALPPEPVANS